MMRIPPAITNKVPLLVAAGKLTASCETVAVTAGGGLAISGGTTTAFVGAADTATGGTGLVSERELDCGTELVRAELAGGSVTGVGPLIIISCVGGGGDGLVLAEFPMIINGGTVETGGSG